MRLLLAILLGKLISHFSQFFRIGGGSSAPGLYALKIEPRLVEKLIKHIPQNVVITGTNGKTTTARILAHLAKEAGLKVIRNHTGSNLERGVASALTHHSSLITHHSFDLGIWELDEAAFNIVVHKIKPQIVIFLNVSRDQLDRYGEVDKLVNDWCNTLKTLTPQTLVLINADEPDLTKLKECFKGEVATFGKKNLKNVKLSGLKGSEFKIKNLNFKINLPGMYHVHNALAAITCAYHLNIPVKSLNNFSPAFGRVEKLPFGYIFLIKNPAGATQVFQTLAPLIRKQDRLLMALNDNLADGTDVSWIWDADYEKFKVQSEKCKVICSGTRAYDLAVRLKYAGFDPDLMGVEPNLKKALKQARMGLKGQLFILPTYTALLELQKILKKHYWRET